MPAFPLPDPSLGLHSASTHDIENVDQLACLDSLTIEVCFLWLSIVCQGWANGQSLTTEPSAIVTTPTPDHQHRGAPCHTLPHTQTHQFVMAIPDHTVNYTKRRLIIASFVRPKPKETPPSEDGSVCSLGNSIFSHSMTCSTKPFMILVRSSSFLRLP